jgi:hypothetical protein
MAKKEKNAKVEMVEKTSLNESPKYVTWLFGILSFILPPVGYVLYLVWKNSKFKVSQFCGWGSLIGCFFYIILAIILILVL